ncbi:PAS domain-containing protein [uncultured Maribacter sp.]|uniref:PAS domain-containing sensor histidine kinase n=1 Tax=uncultured Maribacter sp. TaxID=431308 RepID=UPI00261C4A06|nr:PAS domain-containing protein [uncultured Maribacter sp.]
MIRTKSNISNWLGNLDGDTTIDEFFFDGLWGINLAISEDFWFSQKFCNTLEYTSEKVFTNKKTLLSLIHNEDREHFISVCNKIKNDSDTLNCTIRFYAKRGIVWMKLRGKIISQEEGNCKILGSAISVTQIKEKEQELEQKVNYYKNIIKGGNVATWELNYNTGVVSVNENYSKILGYKVSELDSLTIESWSSLMHPEDKDSMHKVYASILENIDTCDNELRLKHKKGHWVWVISSGKLTDVNEDGTPKLASGFLYDITSRKTNELLLLDYSNIIKKINHVAKIGLWDIVINYNEVFDSSITIDDSFKELTEIPNGFHPTLSKSIDIIKGKENKKEYKATIERAIKYGEDYDVIYPILTRVAKKTKWVRIIGMSEFKNGKCIRLFGFLLDVDKETRLSQTLAFKEEEFRQTFNQATIGMGVVDLENNLKEANNSLVNIFEYTKEEAYKVPYESIMHPEDYNITMPLIQEVIQGRRNFFSREVRGVTKFGKEIWVFMNLSAIKNDKGELIHLLIQMLDVTEKKKTELKLADYSNLMARINTAAKIGIWELNLENNKVYWDVNIKKMLGVPADYIATLEEDISYFKEGYSRDTITLAVKNALEKGVGFDVFLEVFSKPRNKYIWARTTGIVEFSKGKCNRLYGFFQDVDKKTRVSKELTIKEEELRNTFNQASIGMAFIGQEAKVLKVNNSLSKIVGYSKDELLRLTYGSLAHPEDKEKTKILLNDVSTNKKSSVKGEIRIIHKDGRIIWVTLVISAVKNDSGKLVHMLLQVHDTTKNKLLTENLKEHNNRLVNFAHIVSHNLRSHASNISMLLDLTGKDFPKIMENQFLKNIKIVSDNMNDTIYDLNKIVEIKSNISASLSSYKLIDFVDKSIQNTNSLIKEANAKIAIDVPKGISVLAIQAYLESIVLNLITNAIKYRMPDRRLKIYITAKIEWDNVVFSVEDNGLGIDLNKHGDKLFGLYKVFHAHKDAKGIGLFLVKNQLEAMGGKIKVESKEHLGTKFTTYFKIG